MRARTLPRRLPLYILRSLLPTQVLVILVWCEECSKNHNKFDFTVSCGSSTKSPTTTSTAISIWLVHLHNCQDAFRRQKAFVSFFQENILTQPHNEAVV